MSFYKNFEKICKAQGKTPFKVTQEIGLSNSILSYWRKGERYPKKSTLNKIADYLNVTTTELTREPDIIYSINDEYFTEEEYEQIKTFIEFIKSKRRNME